MKDFTTKLQETVFTHVAQRYGEWPRAMKWVVWAVGVVVVFYVVIDPSLKEIASLNASSDQLRNKIARYVSGDLKKAVAQIQEGNEQWGGPKLLTGEDATGVLSETLNRILNSHGIVPSSSKTVRGGEIKASSAGSGAATSVPISIRTTRVRVQFTAAPHVMTAILSDLESEPTIARIAALQIDRMPDQAKLLVTLTAEAWIIKES